jgi:Tfp pilus assembly protein PilN
MLRTNLSTRPFYNERAVRMALGAAAVILLGAVLFNAARLVTLGMSQESLGSRAAESENEATRLRIEAERMLAQINTQDLEIVADAAREANAIIDQRAFSWTALFERFEATLPADVRITAIQPRLEREGDFVVAIGVQARRAEDLDTFVESLETGAGFHNALAIQSQTDIDGMIEAIVEGVYSPPLDDMGGMSPELLEAAPQGEGA